LGGGKESGKEKGATFKEKTGKCGDKWFEAIHQKGGPG